MLDAVINGQAHSIHHGATVEHTSNMYNMALQPIHSYSMHEWHLWEWTDFKFVRFFGSHGVQVNNL